MSNKLVIGDISGHKDVSGVLFDLMAKWGRSIEPIHLAAFNQGKNAWDGSFTDNPPKDVDGLITELRTQLLSGAKTMAQLKLFLIKKDYTNLAMCHMQDISDFYQEVFGVHFSTSNGLTKRLSGDNFMYFAPKLIFNDSGFDFTHEWIRYRFGENYHNQINHDDGILRCEPLNFSYGTRPATFLKNNARSAKDNYLLTYSEAIEADVNHRFSNFTYPYNGYSEEFTNQKGLTFRETCILLMFKCWKDNRYFAGKEKNDIQLIPCYGSICAKSDYDKKYWPIPVVYITENEIKVTYASTKAQRPRAQTTKNFRVQEVFEL